MNPTRLHEAADPNSPAHRVEQAQVDNYYKALALARPVYDDHGMGTNDPVAITNFVYEGISLVDAYCLRWFHRVEDTQRKVDLNEKDFNIIRQLGTVALGIAAASPNWVTGYGAINTAIAGGVENFNTALLTAPTAKKVKSKTLQMMADYAKVFKTDAATLRFSEAYGRLEIYADICTFVTIRDAIDSSLDTTHTIVDQTSGKLRTTVIESTFQEDEASDRLLQYWMPGGKVDVAHDATLKDWIKQNHLGSISIPFLINTKLYAPWRRKAVVDLSVAEVTK